MPTASVRRRALALLVSCGAAISLALSACSSATESLGPGAETVSPSVAATNDDSPTADELPAAVPTSDGQADAPQETVRTGPIAQYGGPAYGDQGVEEIEPGLWCDTISVFWNGDPVPADVSFVFDTAVPDRPGLATEPGVCGTKGATASCLGLTVAGDHAGSTCSIVLRPETGFQEGTQITFDITLRCPTAEVCDAVASRAGVDPGPPIIVFTPPPVSS